MVLPVYGRWNGRRPKHDDRNTTERNDPTAMISTSRSTNQEICVLTYRGQGWGCWTEVRFSTANWPSWRRPLRRFSFLLKQYKRAQSINPSIPIRYPRIPANFSPSFSLQLIHPLLYCFVSLFIHPFPSLPLCYIAYSRSDLIPPFAPSFLADCPFYALTPKPPYSPFASYPNPYSVSTIFFLSNPCLGVCPLNESPPRRCASCDVHNHKTRDAYLPKDRFCIHVDILILFPFLFILFSYFLSYSLPIPFYIFLHVQR